MIREVRKYPALRLILGGSTALAGAVAVSTPALATSPVYPVAVVKSSQLGASALDIDLSANAGEVSDFSARVSIASNGVTVRQDDVPSRSLALPSPMVSVEERLSGPRVPVETLPAGVYARAVLLSAKLRGQEASKPLELLLIDYFRVARGSATSISSEEYSLAVQPLQLIPGEAGPRQSQAGAGVEAGIVRGAADFKPGPRHDIGNPVPPRLPSSGRR